MHAHRSADEHQLAIVEEATNLSCELLRSLVQPPLEQSTKKGPIPAAPTKKAAPNARPTRKRVAPKDPVTPKPNRRKGKPLSRRRSRTYNVIALQDVPLNAPSVEIDTLAGDTSALLLDQPANLLDVLRRDLSRIL